ncbi:MAG: glutaredoxin family protein [Pyrinomonadaceae bacterium]
MSKVKVYGADWCGDTKRSRRLLERLGVAYDYINLEEDTQAAEWVKQQNNGKEQKPTILVGDQVLSVPSDEELEKAVSSGQ